MFSVNPDVNRVIAGWRSAFGSYWAEISLIEDGSGWPCPSLEIGNDFEYLYYRPKLLVIEGLSRGTIPLWSPSEAAGYPLYSNPFAAVFYPLNLFTAPDKPIPLNLCESLSVRREPLRAQRVFKYNREPIRR